MNRKKKINETLKKRAKKANAKLQTSNKPKYISKAERARLEAESNDAIIQSENNELQSKVVKKTNNLEFSQ